MTSARSAAKSSAVEAQGIAMLPLLAPPKPAKAGRKAPAAAAKRKAPPAAAPKAFKRSREEELLQDEVTRMTYRVRLTDGSSKGFKYSSIDEKPRVKEQAVAFLLAQKAEREAAPARA